MTNAFSRFNIESNRYRICSFNQYQSHSLAHGTNNEVLKTTFYTQYDWIHSSFRNSKFID